MADVTRTRAVVSGSGISGLFTAGALADADDELLGMERDTAKARRGIAAAARGRAHSTDFWGAVSR